jgi:hypothetical protein
MAAKALLLTPLVLQHAWVLDRSPLPLLQLCGRLTVGNEWMTTPDGGMRSDETSVECRRSVFRPSSFGVSCIYETHE